MIEYQRVSVRYPGARDDVLRVVSFRAEPGGVTAVVGPNGSGKSTLVRALLGRVAVGAGAILVGGTEARALAGPELARRVAVVPQREDPIFPMRLRDYVALGRYPHLGPWRTPGAADARAIDEGMARAGVSGLAERPTDQLSGGEWQRARIARALAQETGALVLDEPTTFLDVAHEMGLFELLARLAREGRVVLLVSHQLSLVARYADQVVLLDRGAIAASGPVNEVMRGDVLEKVYGWPMRVAMIAGVPTVTPLPPGNGEQGTGNARARGPWATG